MPNFLKNIEEILQGFFRIEENCLKLSIMATYLRTKVPGSCYSTALGSRLIWLVAHSSGGPCMGLQFSLIASTLVQRHVV